jgi:cytosine/adenosine deaminase-related metal-dependent hydrolase
MFLEPVQTMGGFFNAHTHLDRADTILDMYLSHINTTPLKASAMSLRAKQNMTGYLHTGPAYTEADLWTRMSRVIERLISYGTTYLSTCIDTTPDIGEGGLLALRVALELKEKYADRITIQVGSNPIFGFKKDTGRREVFEAAAKKADFLSALPEKDEITNPLKPDGKIGFEHHLRDVINLGRELGKPVYIHLDQANDPNENGTETLIDCLRFVDPPVIEGFEGPTVWAIHMISPSAYDELRFRKLIEGLKRKGYEIGVIVCPTAAISMRQLRPELAPTHNCIARILELCLCEVPVRFGTDNIADLFVPQSSGDMLAEIVMGGHAIRFASPHVWAKLAAGVPLNDIDRETIADTLAQDLEVFKKLDPNWEPAITPKVA